MYFATFSRFKKKIRTVERKEERDICVGDCLLGNIADPYKYLFGPWLLKFCYILNVPSSRNLFVVLFVYRVAAFCMFLFNFIFASIYSR